MLINILAIKMDILTKAVYKADVIVLVALYQSKLLLYALH